MEMPLAMRYNWRNRVISSYSLRCSFKVCVYDNEPLIPKHIHLPRKSVPREAYDVTVTETQTSMALLG